MLITDRFLTRLPNKHKIKKITHSQISFKTQLSSKPNSIKYDETYLAYLRTNVHS